MFSHPPMRTYRSFTHKDAVLRICCEPFDAVTAELVRQRALLETYIERHPEFGRSMSPLSVLDDAPPIARQMAGAAQRVGVGPMAAVAGAMAQAAARAGLDAGAGEAIVENGGDIYAAVVEPVVIRLYAGDSDVRDRLAFRIEPDRTPLAVCSSSGKMGHSTSLGRCDLATVVAADAALADAAATQAANLVSAETDIDAALESVNAIDGVAGVLIAHGTRIGLAGDLPELVGT